MIQVFMNLIKKWEKKNLFKINYINIIDNSINLNDGNIAGTVCYIRNIGKYFPWFRFKGKTYNLRNYDLNSEPNNWFPEIGINIKFDNQTNKWEGGGLYFFYKQEPNNKINNKESVLKNSIKLNKSKKSRKFKKSKKHIRKIKLKSK